MKKNSNLPNITKETSLLFQDLSLLIEQSKKTVASFVNNAMAMLFWHVGSRINTHVLSNKRAAYGKEIIVTLSRQLVLAHGNNFEEKNLRRMMQFAEIFDKKEIVVTLSRQLSWSHFLAIIPLRSHEALRIRDQ